MLLVSAAHMRELDRRTIDLGTPGHVLMERAGEGAYAVLLDQFPVLRKKGARVVVLAGQGNNGGDGFVIARLLRKRGARVSVWLVGTAEAVKGDARRNLDAYGGTVRELDGGDTADLERELGEAACVVDALLGTGLRSEVGGPQAAAIALMSGCGVPVFAVDIPSGLDADTGRPRGATVHATATATFGFAKYGQVIHPGVEHCGKLVVIDIGLAAAAIEALPPDGALVEASDAARLLPRRSADDHKGSAGHLLVVAGSRGKSGAAVLSTRAALRSGAGLVTLATPESAAAVCAGGAWEAMTEPWPERDGALRYDVDRLARAVDGKSAVAVGPGLGAHRSVRDIVLWLLRYCAAPVVLDADALNVLARNPQPLRRARCDLVLTPHPGEMARLAGIDSKAVQADRVGVARRFATEHRCTVVLKGARTVIAAADGFVWINPTGNPGMASGGMGDALTGVVGALLAQGLAAPEAARLGAYLHGAAGDRVAMRGGVGMVASDLIERLPETIANLGSGDGGA